MSTKNDRETEVKIAVPNVEAIRQRLDALGFKESAPRLFEANTLYDTAERKLRCGEMLLRLREVGGKGVVTTGDQ